MLWSAMLLCQTLRLLLDLVLITSFSPPVLLSIGCRAGNRPQVIGPIKQNIQMPSEKEILKLDSASISRRCSSLPQAAFPFKAKFGFCRQTHKALTLKLTVSIARGHHRLG